jgi:2-amino-4-hydroxy-6-hydroxymethyldihydropteridine diphosphokinase
MKYYLSLGSNLGDRRTHLRRALSFLGEVGTIGEISSVYETSPVEMEPGAGFFLNLVLSMDTGLLPRDLLARIKDFERKQGRDLSPGSPRSRPIDIDILLWGHRIIDEGDLRIPHPRLAERAFVLVPLCEIVPELVHPRLKRKMIDILGQLSGDERVIKSGGLI